MTLNGGAAFSGNNLVLTDGNINEARSAFFNVPVNVQQFSTTFNVQLTNASADGFTFTLQGGGPKTLGGTGSSLGSRGIPKSVAVKFDLYNNGGEGPNSTGMYLNGAAPTVPAINLTGTGINLHSGDLLNVLLTYNGTTLTEVITDFATGAMAIETYTVNIPSIVGGNTAYAGYAHFCICHSAPESQPIALLNEEPTVRRSQINDYRLPCGPHAPCGQGENP